MEVHWPKILSAVAVFWLGLGVSGLAQAALVHQPLEYSFETQKFIGYLVYDDAFSGPRPAILVFPEWWGLNDNMKHRAEQLAQWGYVALAVDMYGEGKVAADAKAAMKMSGDLKKDMPRLLNHAWAAYNTLAKQKQVDPSRLGAIGFCFGGTTDLALAFAGADLKGIVSFHGGLIVPESADVPKIKAKILILHGALDPYSSPETIQKLQTALEKGGKDWQMTLYSGTAHAFTNPNAGDHPESGSAYNAVSTERAIRAMRNFFEELFPAPGQSFQGRNEGTVTAAAVQ
jgi:dienelactone hydrolase